MKFKSIINCLEEEEVGRRIKKYDNCCDDDDYIWIAKAKSSDARTIRKSKTVFMLSHTRFVCNKFNRGHRQDNSLYSRIGNMGIRMMKNKKKE